MKTLRGKDVLISLAQTYRQLYIAPAQGAKEKYLDIVLRGQDPKEKDLSHFFMSKNDMLTCEETPAGTVSVITLGRRDDFITFLRIMGNQCEMVSIPDTQGASIIDGVINWRKIESHMQEYTLPDVVKEFKRFTSDNRNFKDTIIVLSIGPYSAVPASKLGVPDDEWITLSSTIRKYHECTHFICRRLYPDKKEAVWDELVADAVGIYAAFNRFDPDMEKVFLGIEENTYTGGRLENYVSIDKAITQKVCNVLDRFSDIVRENAEATPYELAILLEEEMDELWTPAGR